MHAHVSALGLAFTFFSSLFIKYNRLCQHLTDCFSLHNEPHFILHHYRLAADHLFLRLGSAQLPACVPFSVKVVWTGGATSRMLQKPLEVIFEVQPQQSQVDAKRATHCFWSFTYNSFWHLVSLLSTKALVWIAETKKTSKWWTNQSHKMV